MLFNSPVTSNSTSNTLSQWVKYELYPALFDRIDQVFPEHCFVAFPGGWRSKTYLDATPHKSRIDKLVVSKKVPGSLVEQGGEVISLVEYVMRRDKVDFIPALKTLAERADLSIPVDPSYDRQAYLASKSALSVLEQANLYFIYCLETSSGAEKLRNYLSLRGYTSEDIKAMELGYLPSQEKLFKFLTVTKKFPRELVEEALKIMHDGRIGTTHKLSIPYRSGGQIKGFKFRTIENEVSPKYLNMPGLDRNGGFFNLSGLKGRKELTLVEGELDCLHATIRGVENTGAMGGSAIHPDQLNDAQRRGVTSITLCFDREEGMHSKIAKALDMLQKQGGLRIYVATLPDLGGKTDPDRFIKEAGIDAFHQVLDHALPFYTYQLNTLMENFLLQETDLTPKDMDRLLEEVVLVGSKINDPLDRDRFTQSFLLMDSIRLSGITQKSLLMTMERLNGLF